MAGLVHERSSVKLPPTAPAITVVILLRTSPENVYGNHVDAAKSAFFDSAFQQLQSAVFPVLFDHEEPQAGTVEDVDHVPAVLPPRSHRLLSYHVTTGLSRLNCLARMQSAGRREYDHVRLRLNQQLRQRFVSRRPVLRHGCLQTLGVGIAHPRKFEIVHMGADRRKVIPRNPSAAYDGKPYLAPRDGQGCS